MTFRAVWAPPDPSLFPAGSKVHIIERGDTLWDLARRFYGDAYLWPQLWELNTYIRDSHWIYPGDPLLVQGELTTGEVVTETVTEAYPET
ncbi:MAG: LysM peptidoglycan-binding domain-containing protein, partial [Thermoanaerobaculia bacterium]